MNLPNTTPRAAMTAFASLFAVLLIAALWLLVRVAPPWRATSVASPATTRMTWQAVRDNQAFRALLLPY
jgi:hypothetical protein